VKARSNLVAVIARTAAVGLAGDATATRIAAYDARDEVVRSYTNYRGERVDVTRGQAERTEAATRGLAALGLDDDA
jgi:hypothetical protein